MSVNILILVGTGDGLQLAKELGLNPEFNIYIFVDNRSRLRSNLKVGGEISALRNKVFFHRFLIEKGIEALKDATPWSSFMELLDIPRYNIVSL